jgi:hypothetical protein
MLKIRAAVGVHYAEPLGLLCAKPNFRERPLLAQRGHRQMS